MKWGLKTSFNATANPISSITSTNENTDRIQNQHHGTSDNPLDSAFTNFQVIGGTQDIVKRPAARHPTEYSSDSSPSYNANTSDSSPSSSTKTSISSPS